MSPASDGTARPDAHIGHPPAPAARVTAVEPLNRRGRRVRLVLDQGEPIELALEVVERSGLGAGDPLDDALRAQLADAELRWQARDAALAYLAHRPRSREETRRRLFGRAFPHVIVEACLEQLVADGLLDDRAFADALVRERLSRNPRGPARLRDELGRRGVADDEAAAAVTRGMAAVDTSDEALAVAAALRWLRGKGARERDALAGAAGASPSDRAPIGQRWFGRLGATPRAAAIRRLTNFLRGRGFGSDAVRVAIAAAEAEARRPRR